MIFSADFGEIYCRLWERYVELLHCLHDDFRNRDVAEPFVVRGDDEPRRVLGAALAEYDFIGLLVIEPVLSFRIIRFANLSAPRRIVQSLLESLQLLFFADVQEELQDVCSVRYQAPLEVVDLLVAL